MKTLTTLIAGLSGAAALAAASPTTQEPEALATLDWFAGHWCQERDGETIEEHWVESRGGLMLGMGRTVVAGRARAFEFLRIELRDGTPTFVAQPNGAPPTPFLLVKAGPDWATFENPDHDFPKRVHYRRTARGLHAEIAGPGEGQHEKVISFDYVACAATGAP